MSGIAGFWNRDGRPVDIHLLDRMGATLAHRGPDANGTVVVESLGMICRLARITPESAHETQPARDASGATLVFDGRLDNREDLLRALRGEGGVSHDAPDSALALAAFRRYGDAVPEWLLGDFALAVFDPTRQRLLLATDAIGLRPLYYHVAPRTFLFASEIKAILADPAVPAAPDDDVVADLLLNGLAAEDVEGLTCFRGIRSVLPAHVVSVTPDGVTNRRYWDFDPGRQIRFRRFEDYVAAFRERFTLAVQRRLRSAAPVGVSVSGGVDSSAIFCMAHSLQRSQPGLPAVIGATYTFPDGSQADEQRFLGPIENQYDVRIRRADHLPGGVTRRAREAVWHVEAPALDLQWNRTSGFLACVRETGVRVLLTGHWGDQVLFDSAYLLELCRRGRWSAAWSQAGGLGAWLSVADASHFRRDLLRRFAREMVPRVLVPFLRRLRRAGPSTGRSITGYSGSVVRRARLAASRRPQPPARFGPFARSLYSEARSRHHVHCMEWNGKAAAMHGLEMAFPFLDRDLLTFQLATPGEVQVRNGVPKILLREAMNGIMPAAIAWRSSKADFTGVVNAGLADDFEHIISTFAGRSRAAQMGYLGGQPIEHGFRRAPSRETIVASRALVDLFALEMWLQEWFHSNRHMPRGVV